MHRSIRSGLALSAALLIAPACAARTSSGSVDGISHPRGGSQLVLQVESAGGLLAPTVALRQGPSFTLMGDGRMVTPGPQIEIYPGPALPNLQARAISEEGVQRILEAAQKAGLLGADRQLLGPLPISDAPTTTFNVVAGGARHVVSVYALNEATDNGMIPPDEQKVRASLVAFQSQLSDLERWLPAGSVGVDGPYTIDRLQVSVTASPSPLAAVPFPEPPVDWPLEPGLASFGTALQNQFAGYRCGVVEGAELAKLLPLVRKANELTPWRSDGLAYQLVLRPLVTDEPGCTG
jgi:hypothetical protein